MRQAFRDTATPVRIRISNESCSSASARAPGAAEFRRSGRRFRRRRHDRDCARLRRHSTRNAATPRAASSRTCCATSRAQVDPGDDLEMKAIAVDTGVRCGRPAIEAAATRADLQQRRSLRHAVMRSGARYAVEDDRGLHARRDAPRRQQRAKNGSPPFLRRLRRSAGRTGFVAATIPRHRRGWRVFCDAPPHALSPRRSPRRRRSASPFTENSIAAWTNPPAGTGTGVCGFGLRAPATGGSRACAPW